MLEVTVCGMKKAGHHHVFWSCPKLTHYWEKFKKSVEKVVAAKIPLHFETLFLGIQPDCIKGVCKKYMWNILLVARKKAITKKWMIDELPTLEDWINLVNDISQMERHTFALRLEYDKYEESWKPWTDFINTRL